MDPDLQTRLHPNVILFRGRPVTEAFNLWDKPFPGASIIVFSEDSRLPLDESAEASSTAVALTTKAVERFYRLYRQALREHKVPKRRTIRYRLHTAYQQLRFDCPGQRFYQVRCKRSDGSYWLESDIWLRDLPFEQHDIAQECVSHRTCLTSLSLTISSSRLYRILQLAIRWRCVLDGEVIPTCS